jgi:hypothetical protein
VGQKVRAFGYGDPVPSYVVGCIGTVVRFTRTGHPVVEVSPPGWGTRTFTDRYGCFRLIDEDGHWVRDAALADTRPDTVSVSTAPGFSSRLERNSDGEVFISITDLSGCVVASIAVQAVG